MSLDDLRARIDGIDEALVGLLEERAKVAVEVAREKLRAGRDSFYDPTRERAVLARAVAKLGATGAPLLGEAAVRAIWREIVAACLALEKPLRVAYLGPEGTFSQVAARTLFGDGARYVEAATIEGVFDAVDRGDADRGVVPFENSTEGSVAATVRALLRAGDAGDAGGRPTPAAHIERELVLDVAHSLVSRAGSLAAVKRVYSHPQALAQCAAWLRDNLPAATPVPAASTAAAAREVAGDPEGAALASPLAGELFGLRALAHGVQDARDNATRFVVVGPRDATPTGDDKTTVAFELADAPGALRAALGAFEDEGVNLTRIESHPASAARRVPGVGKPWSYVFVCDMAGHRDDAASARALAKLGAVAKVVRVLGSYPRYKAAQE